MSQPWFRALLAALQRKGVQQVARPSAYLRARASKQQGPAPILAGGH